MLAADAPDQIAKLTLNKKFRGIRPMLQSIPQLDWILNPGLLPCIDASAIQFYGLEIQFHNPSYLKTPYGLKHSPKL